MKTLLTSTLILAVVLSCIAGAFGHSYVTSPTSRSNQKQTQSGCRGPACLGPCDRTKDASGNTPAVTIQRGAPITVQWPRNNHAGGFIRLAWASFDQSDSHAAFDAGVQQFSCHEVGCGPSDPSNPLGGDTNPADGSVNPCTASITVPPHLADGKYTLQWAWFGGAFQLGDYYSCVDYIVSGGASGSQPSPVFKGGDYGYPGQQKCRFFNTDRLHVCVNEPCSNGAYPVAQAESGPPAGFGGSSNPTTTGVQGTTGVQTPATTGVQAPATTGVQTPATTGVQTPATTGVQQVAGTTGVQAAGTTGAQAGIGSGATPVPLSGGSSSTCSDQACCDSLSRPNEDTGVGYLAFNPSACANGGLNCFQNSGCQLCYKTAPSPNTANLPLCPSSKRSEVPSQEDVEDNAAGSMRWVTFGTFLIWTVFVLLI